MNEWSNFIFDLSKIDQDFYYVQSECAGIQWKSPGIERKISQGYKHFRGVSYEAKWLPLKS